MFPPGVGLIFFYPLMYLLLLKLEARREKGRDEYLTRGGCDVQYVSEVSRQAASSCCACFTRSFQSCCSVTSALLKNLICIYVS